MKKLNLVEDADLVTRIYDAIYNVTEDPVHKVEEDGKNKLYNSEKYQILAERIFQIIKNYELNDDKIPESIKLAIINDYIKNNVKIRHEYFDAFEERIPEIPESEIQYRSAYSALVEGQTMCAGYAEAFRVLCESVGIKSRTILSKLPGKNKHLIHYVVLATQNNGTTKLFDPEREAACFRKNYDFNAYQNSMDFMLSSKRFNELKVGTNGVGLDVKQFIEKSHKTEKGCNKLFYFRKNENGEIEAYIMGEREIYNPSEYSSMTSCATFEKLMTRENFLAFLAKEDSIVIVHGKNDVDILEYIANKIDEFKSKHGIGKSVQGEFYGIPNFN